MITEHMAPRGKKRPPSSWPGKLRRLQAHLGRTNPEMADYLGVSLRNYNAWKWGENEPPGTARRLIDLELAKIPRR